MSFESARRQWDAEVEEEAERLIKRGMSPWNAAAQARDNISAKRREVAREEANADMQRQLARSPESQEHT